MNIEIVENNTLTTIFKITNNNESILVKTRFVATDSEVQAEHLLFKGVKYDRWKVHGSFIKLINKCLGSNLRDERGDRKILLENLYHNHKIING